MTFEQVANPLLGPSAQRPNLLTNGGFEIWQRGNGPYTTNGAWTADAWQLTLDGTDTLSVQKDSGSADGVGLGALCAYTHGTGTLTRLIHQFHINTEFPNLLGKTVTFSVRVKTSTANAVRLGANLYVGSNNFVYGNYHSGGGTFETLTLTVTLATNLAYFQPGIFFSTSCSASLDNAMLVVGAQPADYVPMHPADDLARCLRYYELIVQDNEWMHFGSGSGVITSYLTTPYKAIKPITPTVTKVGSFAVTNCGQPTCDVSGRWGFRSNLASLGAGVFYTTTSSPSAYWTSEANP